MWQMGLLVFLSISFGQYALSLWLPQMVSGFSGLTNLQVGFISAIPNLVAVIAMVIVAAHSRPTPGSGVCISPAPPPVAAAGFLGCALVQSPAASVMFLSIAAAGLLSAHGPFWPLPSKFLSGAAAAGGIALINSLANLSGFAGPVRNRLCCNDASGNFRSGFFLLALAPLAGAVLALRLRSAAVLRDSTGPGTPLRPNDHRSFRRRNGPVPCSPHLSQACCAENGLWPTSPNRLATKPRFSPVHASGPLHERRLDSRHDHPRFEHGVHRRHGRERGAAGAAIGPAVRP